MLYLNQVVKKILKVNAFKDDWDLVNAPIFKMIQLDENSGSQGVSSLSFGENIDKMSLLNVMTHMFQ